MDARAVKRGRKLTKAAPKTTGSSCQKARREQSDVSESDGGGPSSQSQSGGSAGPKGKAFAKGLVSRPRACARAARPGTAGWRSRSGTRSHSRSDSRSSQRSKASNPDSCTGWSTGSRSRRSSRSSSTRSTSLNTPKVTRALTQIACEALHDPPPWQPPPPPPCAAKRVLSLSGRRPPIIPLRLGSGGLFKRNSPSRYRRLARRRSNKFVEVKDGVVVRRDRAVGKATLLKPAIAPATTPAAAPAPAPATAACDVTERLSAESELATLAYGENDAASLEQEWEDQDEGKSVADGCRVIPARLVGRPRAFVPLPAPDAVTVTVATTMAPAATPPPPPPSPPPPPPPPPAAAPAKPIALTSPHWRTVWEERFLNPGGPLATKPTPASPPCTAGALGGGGCCVAGGRSRTPSKGQGQGQGYSTQRSTSGSDSRRSDRAADRDKGRNSDSSSGKAGGGRPQGKANAQRQEALRNFKNTRKPKTAKHKETTEQFMQLKIETNISKISEKPNSKIQRVEFTTTNRPRAGYKIMSWAKGNHNNANKRNEQTLRGRRGTEKNRMNLRHAAYFKGYGPRGEEWKTKPKQTEVKPCTDAKVEVSTARSAANQTSTQVQKKAEIWRKCGLQLDLEKATRNDVPKSVELEEKSTNTTEAGDFSKEIGFQTQRIVGVHNVGIQINIPEKDVRLARKLKAVRKLVSTRTVYRECTGTQTELVVTAKGPEEAAARSGEDRDKPSSRGVGREGSTRSKTRSRSRSGTTGVNAEVMVTERELQVALQHAKLEALLRAQERARERAEAARRAIMQARADEREKARAEGVARARAEAIANALAMLRSKPPAAARPPLPTAPAPRRPPAPGHCTKDSCTETDLSLNAPAPAPAPVHSAAVNTSPAPTPRPRPHSSHRLKAPTGGGGGGGAPSKAGVGAEAASSATPHVAVSFSDGREKWFFDVSQWHVSSGGQLVFNCALSQQEKDDVTRRLAKPKMAAAPIGGQEGEEGALVDRPRSHGSAPRDSVARHDTRPRRTSKKSIDKTRKGVARILISTKDSKTKSRSRSTTPETINSDSRKVRNKTVKKRMPSRPCTPASAPYMRHVLRSCGVRERKSRDSLCRDYDSSSSNRDRSPTPDSFAAHMKRKRRCGRFEGRRSRSPNKRQNRRCEGRRSRSPNERQNRRREGTSRSSNERQSTKREGTSRSSNERQNTKREGRTSRSNERQKGKECTSTKSIGEMYIPKMLETARSLIDLIQSENPLAFHNDKC